MKQSILLVCASCLVLSAQAQALSLFGTSTKEYVDRAIAVTDAQTNLKDISELSRTVQDKEKTISLLSAQMQKTTMDAVADLERKMQALLDDKIKETEFNIKILNDKKERREADIQKLEQDLQQESSLLSYAKMANAASFGYLQSMVSWAKSWTEVGRTDAEFDVGALSREILDIEKQIAEEKTRMREYLTSTQIQESQGKLSRELLEARAAMDKVQLIVHETRQKTIFDKHNSSADELIAKLNQSLKNAKCSGITNMAEAKDAALASCKAQYIEKIVKAKAKVPECAKLTPTATADDLGACKKVL